MNDILKSPHKKTNIIGVPGAGKTQLVCDIATLNKNKLFMYLSFGKENTVNAIARMPQNVICSSFHALAKNKMNINSSRLIEQLTMSHVNKILISMGAPTSSAKILEAFVILNDIFCSSASELRDIPQILDFKRKLFPQLTKEERVFVDTKFRLFWRSAWLDGSNQLTTHEMYLKEYSLNASKISVDYLIIDEAQDLNSAMFHLVDSLSYKNPSLKIIKLGDPCQQIFSFIGASERFLNETYHYKLDETHRFGEDLASKCNEFMSSQNLKYYTPIKSVSDNRTTVNRSPSINELCKSITSGFKPTIIARHNMTLLYMMKQLVSVGIKCAINGDNAQELGFLQELHSVYLGNNSLHPKLKNKSYGRYLDKALILDDKTALLACRFVESLGEDGSLVFENMKNGLVDKRNAQVLLTTVHQAKGLEFSHLVMMDDFTEVWDDNIKKFKSIEREEAHIIYTAITRAKLSISLPKSWDS